MSVKRVISSVSVVIMQRRRKRNRRGIRKNSWRKRGRRNSSIPVWKGSAWKRKSRHGKGKRRIYAITYIFLMFSFAIEEEIILYEAAKECEEKEPTQGY